MENTFLISLSHLTSLRREMEIIANNLANTNTDAFKSEEPLFREMISPTADGGSAAPDVTFTTDYGTVRDMRIGDLLRTGNRLDVALGNDGYFAVQRDTGKAFTRDGNFKLTNTGELTTSDGYKVLDSVMQPIIFPQGSELPEIAKDGTISVGGVTLQRLGVFKFENPAAMKKGGDNLYTTDEQETPVPSSGVKIIQGSVEASNVQPVLEITRMIDVMRKYQTANQMIETGDDMVRKAIDQLSRIR